MLAQLDTFMYIKTYSEPMAYSDILRTIDIFSQFQARFIKYYSRAIYAYSKPSLGRARDIQNFGLVRHVMFHAYSAYSGSYILGYTYLGIFVHIRV